MGFIADKTRELRTAVQTGDSERAAQILTHTVLESGQTFEATVQEMTETDRRQHPAA